MDRDPFLNPNLEATATSIVLALPPRRVPPWLHAPMLHQPRMDEPLLQAPGLQEHELPA